MTESAPNLRLRLQDHFHLQALTPLVERPLVNVYRGERDGQSVLIKTTERPDLFLRETDSMQRLHAKGAPVPQILTTTTLGDTHVFLQEWWDGDNLEDTFPTFSRDKKAKLLYDAGNMLAHVQQTLSEQDLAAAPFWKQGPYANASLADFSWKHWMEDTLHKWLARVQLTDADRERKIDKCLAFLETLVDQFPEPDRKVILHQDYGLRNIMINHTRDRLLGVIDFENATIGDPLYDLMKLTWNDLDPFDHDLHAHFYRGWSDVTGAAIPRERIALYHAYGGLGAIQWADKDPHHANTAQEFRENGCRILLASCLPFIE